MIESLQSNETWILACGGILGVYIAAFSVFTKVLRQIKEKRKIQRKHFNISLLKLLKLDAQVSFKDVENIYKGTCYPLEDGEYNSNLGHFLRTFLVDIINQEILDDKEKNTLPKETINAWKEIITAWIEENDYKSPFANAPIAERNILEEIDRLVSKQDIEGAREKNKELAGMIQVRQEEQNRSQRINKWTIPLSVAGIFFTIVFGITSFIPLFAPKNISNNITFSHKDKEKIFAELKSLDTTPTMQPIELKKDK